MPLPTKPFLSASQDYICEQKKDIIIVLSESAHTPPGVIVTLMVLAIDGTPPELSANIIQ